MNTISRLLLPKYYDPNNYRLIPFVTKEYE